MFLCSLSTLLLCIHFVSRPPRLPAKEREAANQSTETTDSIGIHPRAHAWSYLVRVVIFSSCRRRPAVIVMRQVRGVKVRGSSAYCVLDTSGSASCGPPVASRHRAAARTLDLVPVGATTPALHMTCRKEGASKQIIRASKQIIFLNHKLIIIYI